MFCKGKNLRRTYFVPTIELEIIEDGRRYLCFVFLKWYVGIFWDIK